MHCSASTSQVWGSGLTLVTAGGISIFRIQTKDVFSNKLNAFTSEPIVDYVPKSRMTRAIRAISSYNTLGQWDILILGLTVSGNYLTQVSLALQGGIWATYYASGIFSSSSSVSKPVATLKQNVVFLTSTNSPLMQQKMPSEAFSVLWKGFISSPQLMRKFSVAVSGADERVRMWIDNSLVVDQWNSLSSTTIQGFQAFYFKEVFTPYVLEIEYSQSVGNYSFDLRWNRVSNQTSDLFFDIIPSSNLFLQHPCAKSPYDTFVKPSVESGHTYTYIHVHLYSTHTNSTYI